MHDDLLEHGCSHTRSGRQGPGARCRRPERWRYGYAAITIIKQPGELVRLGGVQAYDGVLGFVEALGDRGIDPRAAGAGEHDPVAAPVAIVAFAIRLGDALIFPMPHLLSVAPALDLGDAFRAPLAVDTPILFISGPLDGRICPEAVHEAMATLANARMLRVENGGHTIYEADPRMQDIVRTLLRDGVVLEHLVLPPQPIPAP